MAAIPTFLLLGDEHLSGPLPDVNPGTPPSSFYVGFKNYPSLMRPVPYDSGQPTGVPLSPAFRPWFDGQYGGTGDWVVYHHIENAAAAGTKGSTWYEAYRGLGPDVTWMQLLAADYPTGFKFFKFGRIGSRFATWSGAGSARTAFLAQWNQAVARAAAGGDTLDVRGAFLMLGAHECDSENLNMEADLRAMLADLRTTVGSSVPVVMLHHSAELFRTSHAGYAQLLRRVVAQVAADTDGVALVDAGASTFAPAVPILGSPHDPSDPQYYSTDEYLRFGAAAHAMFQAMALTPVQGTGLRVLVSIGTSNTVGAIDALAAVFGQQPAFVGSGPGYLTPGALIWNGTALVGYDVMSTANPLGSVSPGVYGPELTLLADQVARHPGETVALLKIGSGGSTLTPEAAIGSNRSWEKEADDLYTLLLEELAKLKLYALQQRGETVDITGILVNVGDNDMLTQANAERFSARLGPFVTSLQADLKTRVGSDAIPVALVRTHAASALAVTPTARETIRSAIDGLAGARVGVLDIDDLELRRDSVHYGLELTHHIGRAASQLFEDVANGLVRTVTPLPAAAAPTAVAAIDEALAADPDVAAYTVNGRTVQRRSLRELIETQRYLEGRANRARGLDRTQVTFE